jgi:hypothetical protein
VARLSDHDRRDAEHALRAEIALLVGPYIRRILEQGKAIIQTDLESLTGEEDVDGTAIGRAAAARAAAEYFGVAAGKPQAAIEGAATRTPEA